MKGIYAIYLTIFFILISPCLFNFEMWPLSRNNLYSEIYPRGDFKMLGLYGRFETGEEIYINTSDLLRPFFISQVNKNLWKVYPQRELDYSSIPMKVIEKKLKAYLNVINLNLERSSTRKMVRLSLFHVEWSKGMNFENPEAVKKLFLISEVRDD